MDEYSPTEFADATIKAKQAASDSIRREKLEETLRYTLGNITHAACILGISKTHAMRLMKQFSLSEWATDLRLSSGINPFGRPAGT